jgi:hypothetical protein
MAYLQVKVNIESTITGGTVSVVCFRNGMDDLPYDMDDLSIKADMIKYILDNEDNADVVTQMKSETTDNYTHAGEGTEMFTGTIMHESESIESGTSLFDTSNIDVQHYTYILTKNGISKNAINVFSTYVSPAVKIQFDNTQTYNGIQIVPNVLATYGSKEFSLDNVDVFSSPSTEYTIKFEWAAGGAQAVHGDGFWVYFTDRLYENGTVYISSEYNNINNLNVTNHGFGILLQIYGLYVTHNHSYVPNGSGNRLPAFNTHSQFYQGNDIWQELTIQHNMVTNETTVTTPSGTFVYPFVSTFTPTTNHKIHIGSYGGGTFGEVRVRNLEFISG